MSNDDLMWLYEPPHIRYSSSEIWASYTTRASSNTEAGSYWPIVTTSPGYSHLKSLYERPPFPGGIPPELKKEKSVMGYNDTYQKSSQELIDDAVREAIEKPRREAEIAKRIALVTALEGLKDSPVGTVITFAKKNGNKTATPSAGFKFDEDRWAVTGDGRYTNGSLYTWSDLLSHLTTGTDPAENVQVATAFEAVTAAA